MQVRPNVASVEQGTGAIILWFVRRSLRCSTAKVSEFVGGIPCSQWFEEQLFRARACMLDLASGVRIRCTRPAIAPGVRDRAQDLHSRRCNGRGCAALMVT